MAPSNVQDLASELHKLCPNGELTIDHTGQLVFYTGLSETRPHSYLTEWDPEGFGDVYYSMEGI